MRQFPGLTLLKRRDRSFQLTVEVLNVCDQKWGCITCPKMVECTREFDYQVDNRQTSTWRLREKRTTKADAMGGEPDKSGSWMQATLRSSFLKQVSECRIF